MTVLKIIPLLLYGWFFARFCLRLLEPRSSKYIIIGLFAAYELIVDHFIFSRYLNDFMSASLLTHVGLVLLIILLFRGDIVKKIAIGAIGYAIYNLSAYLLVIPLFLADRASDLILTLIERSRFLSAFILLELISRKCTRIGGTRGSSATLLFPVLFVVLVNELIYFAYQRVQLTPLLAMLREREVLPVHNLTDAFVVLLTAALGLTMLLIVVFGNNAVLESRLREQQLGLQVEHYKTLERKSRFFAALRHDIKNHILSLQGLLSREEYDQAARYLERMSDTNEMAEPVIVTGNSAVNAVLNEKYQQALSEGIDFQCDVRIPPSERLDSFDLCIIIGNAVDNAIEACRKRESERFIDIKSGVVKSFLVLEVKNSAVLRDMPTGTSKPDTESHGFGLKNIRAITERNGGTADITLEDGVFTLSVLLSV